jgi:retron-type reverse transcriptase
MKRYSNLWEKVISVENLKLADEKARRGKLNTYGVKFHDKNREANIQALHEALLTKTFRTSPYQVFTIYEPKERVIFRLPYYPDRIVHHAIMNILEPIWTKTFTANTYSCIKGRGIEGCARQVEKIIKGFEGQPLYCLKIDIKKYYPSISHRVTKRLIRRKLKDKDLLWLLDEIIDSVEGLPIGNYLSQYLANLYLCYFMHWVNESLPDLIKEALRMTEKPCIKSTEYADDISFFASSKEVLRADFILSRLILKTSLN